MTSNGRFRRARCPGCTLALALLACQGPADPAAHAGVTRDTLPGGIPLVVNRGEGSWAAGEGWTLEEEWRVGSVDGDGPGSFAWLGDLALDAHGKAYLVEGGSREIRIFDPSGEWLRTVGREGSGPGEFRNVNGVTFAPDGTVWVSDPGNGRYARFSPDGDFLGTHPRTLGFYSSPWMGGMTRDGVLWDQGLVAGDGAPQGRHALLRLDAAAQPVDTFPIPMLEPELFVLEGRMSVGVPFAPSTVWRLVPGGGVWIGDNHRYRLHRVTLPGWDTVAALERVTEPWPVTPEARAMALDDLGFFTDQGGQVEEGRIPRSIPYFFQLQADDGGHLWVLRPDADGGRSFHHLDVFSPEGVFLGTVTSPIPLMNFPLPVIQGDRLLGVTSNELDVPFLVGFRIRGRGDG